MSDVLVMCTCEHPRHGHRIATHRHGRRSMNGETWTVKMRAECTMKMPDGSPCTCGGFVEDPGVPGDAGAGWRPIQSAPRDCTWVEVWNGRETIHAHYADGGGEDQPRFRGWFTDDSDGRGFTAVQPQPTHWRPIK